ncbi:MAG: signal recognition particle-docking protein FtsY [Gemmatimonadota bacterium]
MTRGTPSRADGGDAPLELKAERPGRSLWRRIVDVALLDVNTLVRGGVPEDAFGRLERLLLEADFGVDVTVALVEQLDRAARRGRVSTEEELRRFLEARIREILAAPAPDLGPGVLSRAPRAGDPSVILLLGVNGTGKTTTAAKLAWRLRTAGEEVLLAATDTFRAGAQEQLREWAARVGAEFVGARRGADPASVVFDAIDAARGRRAAWVVIDTAGRLHTQQDLVEELRKIDRVAERKVEGAPHERLLVVDAVSGQNVLSQAAVFGDALALTGVVLAKFDSSARAGTAAAVSRELGLPIRFLGTGEQVEDLEPFEPGAFVEKLFDGRSGTDG